MYAPSLENQKQGTKSIPTTFIPVVPVTNYVTSYLKTYLKKTGDA
ncbi:MAG: hypothetical protein WA638_00775 [Candidatus Acidiferrales bacterium]